MLRKTSMALVAGVLTVATAFPAAARITQCLPEVEQTLNELGVNQTSVKKITVFPRLQPGQSISTVTGYDASVSFNNCRGYLAIDMNRTCQVRQIYSRNECRVPGVTAY